MEAKKYSSTGGEKGSITVETALVFPVIVFCIVALIFGFLLLYQKLLLTKAASLAAQQGAEIWVDSRKKIESGVWDPGERKDSLYYRLFSDTAFNGPYKKTLSASVEELKNEYNTAKSAGRDDIQAKKLSEMSAAIYAELGRGLLKPERTDIKIDFSNTVIQRRLKVTLAQEIRVPLGSIGQRIYGNSTMSLRGTGTAVVAEPAEYIRNVDLGIEYSKKLYNKLDIEEKLEELKKGILGKFEWK